jgi:parallel beta-helix repeat protein
MTYNLRFILLCAFILFATYPSFSQSAIMDVESTNKGVLLPRMTMAQRNAIPSPAHALIIYQTDATSGFYFNQGTPGSPNWQPMSGAPATPCESRIPISSLPFNVPASGSYYLTTHLIGTSGMNGIVINNSNVSIDLNGYTLMSGGGTTGSGIKINSSVENIHISNGNIQGWGDEGVNALSASNSSFKNLRLSSNQHDGLLVGNNNVISDCQSSTNAQDGIDCGKNCTLVNCVVATNGDDGIESDRGCVLTQCSAYLNTDDGINAGFTNTLQNCSSTFNGDGGFTLNSGSSISQCSASNNTGNGYNAGAACVIQGNSARINTGAGFDLSEECYVKDNISDSNGQAGYSSTFDNVRLDNNQSTSNGTYGFNLQGNSNCMVIRNTAVSNTLANYNISLGNTVGPIVGPSVSTVSNPFANIGL